MMINSNTQQWQTCFEHRPSWRGHGSGTASLELRFQPKGGLYVVAWEMTDDQRTICREVMFGLDARQAASLAEWIKTYVETNKPNEDNSDTKKLCL